MTREVRMAGALAVVVAGGIVAAAGIFLGRADVNVSPAPARHEPLPVDSNVAAPRTAGSGEVTAPVVTAQPRTRALVGRVLDGRTERVLAKLKFRVRLSSGTRIETREVTADDEGEFRLTGILQGEYRVSFEHPEYFPVETEISLGEESESSPLEVAFESGITVRGTVRQVGGGSPRDAFPHHAIVEWVAVDEPTSVRQVVCAPGGTYALGGLAPGRYRVRVLPRRLAALWRDARAEEVRLENVPEVTRDLEANLGESLLVRVTRDGAPVAEASVRFQVESRGRSLAGFLAPTDADGNAALRGLPRTGALELTVSSGSHKEGSRRDVDLSRLPRAISIELGEGSTKKPDATESYR